MIKQEDFILLTFKGLPVAKERPRKGKYGIYTPKKTSSWESFAKTIASLAMRNKERFDGAVYIDMVINFPVSATWPDWKKAYALTGLIHHTRTPDADNILKAVGDAMNEVIYKDDSKACVVHVEKKYSYEPSVVVKIGRLNGAPCSLKSKKEVDAYLQKHGGIEVLET